MKELKAIQDCKKRLDQALDEFIDGMTPEKSKEILIMTLMESADDAEPAVE